MFCHKTKLVYAYLSFFLISFFPSIPLSLYSSLSLSLSLLSAPYFPLLLLSLPLPPLSRFAAALLEAAQVDKLIEEETGGEDVLEDRLPLLGVPLTVKEAFALQGRSTHSPRPSFLKPFPGDRPAVSIFELFQN